MKKQFRGSAVLELENDSGIMKLDYYLLEEDKKFEEQNNLMKTYGIEIVKCDDEREVVRDITVNKDEANILVEKLRELGVTPMHLYDVLENFI